jgi:hypothetical protein
VDDRIYMIPAPGVRVTHPAGSPKAMKVIPPAGEWLRLTDYWLRREADGSIVRGSPPAPTQTMPPLRAVKAGV